MGIQFFKSITQQESAQSPILIQQEDPVSITMAVKRLNDVALSDKVFRVKMEEIGRLDHENSAALRAYHVAAWRPARGRLLLESPFEALRQCPIIQDSVG